MNVRSIWQHPWLVLTSSLSLFLAFGCSSAVVEDGGSGTTTGGMPDSGQDAGNTDAGGCQGVNGSCRQNSDCCVPFTCDQNNNKCKVGAVDSGPPDSGTCSKLGDSCILYSDCCAGLGLACNTDAGAAGQVCGTNNTQPTAKCVTNGNSCGDGGACCSGDCISGTCVPWGVCGTSAPNGTCTTGAAACTTDIECCTANTCDGGHCGEVCGGLLAKCVVAADTCCHDVGQQCVDIGSPTAPNPVCLPLTGLATLNPASPCSPSTFACGLATYCNVSISGTDECAPTGLACKSTGLTFTSGQLLSTCQPPSENENCIVGGPACQPLALSSATNLQCLPSPFQGGGNICLQPCVTTADCIDTFATCAAVGDGKACIIDAQNPTCTAPFTSCNSAGTGDGLCQQITFTGGQTGDICFQGATDGGGLGSCCNVNGNRQIGALCAFPNVCNGGICVQGCAANPPAGTAPDSGLLCDTSAGPQYCFFPGIATSGLTLGSCTPPCDALNLGDAGSCPVAAPGNPTQTCTPALLFDQNDLSVADTTVGVCTAAPAGPFVEPGGNCATLPCQEGSLCINQGTGTCRHMCGPVGSFPDGGDNGCQVGETCFALGLSQTTSTSKIGFCDTACDGGPCP